jgi:hypothetical protein
MRLWPQSRLRVRTLVRKVAGIAFNKMAKQFLWSSALGRSQDGRARLFDPQPFHLGSAPPIPLMFRLERIPFWRDRNSHLLSVGGSMSTKNRVPLRRKML